jgi:hypothetical protein
MATRYWVGGTGSWSSLSTTNWSASSGGAGGASSPTFNDDVIFDNLSNTGTTPFTVTVSSGANCRDLSFGSGATALDAVMTLAGTATMSIAGSLTLVSTNLTVTYTGIISFTATTTGKTITSAGKTLATIAFNGTGGEWTLQDAFNCTSSLTVTRGSFNSNGMAVTCSAINSNNANTRAITLGTSTVSLTGTGTIFNITNLTGLTFSAASSTINFTSTSTTARTFNLGSTTGLVFGTIGINGSTTNSSTSFAYGSMTVNTLSSNKTVAHTINFSFSGTAFNVTNFNISGRAGNLVTINSTFPPTAGTISKSSGIVSSDYLSIQNSIATGGATWYAGANSTNVSNNTGWIFTAPPSTGNTSSFFLLFN